jgi:hypothetical protein
MTPNFLGILSIRVSILLHALSTRHLRLNISEGPSRVEVHKGKRVLVKSLREAAPYFPTLRNANILIFSAYRVLPVNPEYRMPFENLMLMRRMGLYKI